MAIYKVINNNQKSSSNGSVKNLKKVINYVANKDKEKNIKEENKQNLEEENVEKFFKKTLKDIKNNMKPIKADYKIYIKTQRELAQKRENPLLKNNNLEKKHSLTR